MKSLDIIPTIDLFATRKNKVLDKYCSPRIDHRAKSRDGFLLNWSKQTAWIHPPIPLIGRCLQQIIT
jgi:hypothetical protein